jgi:hypothetical protein
VFPSTPSKILEHVEKIRRHCLWANKTDEDEIKCNSLVAWDKVCRPKNKGGLSVLSLKIQNHALLMKYLHKFYNKHDVPWVQLLWNSYYTGRIPHAMDPCGSFWWRDVLKLTPFYRGIAICQANNGSSVLFWKDMWSDSVISEEFPRAFSFCKNEDISVQEFITTPALSDNFHTLVSGSVQ